MMAGEANQQAPAYEEFEPFCRWQRSEDRDVLEIHLPGFKKDQLKVQISNRGILKISGERQLDTSTRSKFYKELPVSSLNYDASAIHAKFSNGRLYITIPKMKNRACDIDGKIPAESPKIDQTAKPELIKDQPEAPSPNDRAEEQKPTPDASAEAQFQGTEHPSGSGMAKLAMTLAATAAVMAVLIAYFVYMYKSTNADVDI